MFLKVLNWGLLTKKKFKWEIVDENFVWKKYINILFQVEILTLLRNKVEAPLYTNLMSWVWTPRDTYALERWGDRQICEFFISPHSSIAYVSPSISFTNKISFLRCWFWARWRRGVEILNALRGTDIWDHDVLRLWNTLWCNAFEIIEWVDHHYKKMVISWHKKMSEDICKSVEKGWSPDA